LPQKCSGCTFEGNFKVQNPNFRENPSSKPQLESCLVRVGQTEGMANSTFEISNAKWQFANEIKGGQTGSNQVKVMGGEW
jgi:hypothetical protein